ncbi:hypothetical protein A1OO_06545 [Enterovibrio norvegicus FF-33]|uniref:hypothetical protein n=1 Tax=Enterovibrio norvegicus TaxID=188144 RepID=UPI0002FA07D8|nr:hypothetical protein [Enterovibrio norvegicus]OEE68696.1 hypothetical protein A1OO_06545 [Enterovibrio norvegicus FF-33]
MSIFQTKKAALAVAISSALILSACGGGDDSGAPGGGNIGGGGGDGGGVTQPGGVIITAMDGYIHKALLCADDNSNGVCEPSEVIKDIDGKVLLTDESGHINAEISQADEKRLKTSARLIATVQSLDAHSEVITEDMDLQGQAMKAVTLRAPAGSEIASPITDLVVSKMQSTDTAEGLSKEDAEKAVIESLGGLNTEGELSQDILYSDYILAKETGDDASKELAAKIHKTAQILTETKANASSDEAFDAQLDQVVEATVDATATMKPEDLEDETYKPYVPVVEEPTEPPVIVTNYAVQFNADNVTALKSQVEALEGIFGDVEMWGDDKVISVVVADLIIDKDGKGNTVSIANDKALREANLSVTLASDTLTISRVNPEAHVAKGTYKIQLATNDLNSNGEVVSEQVISTTTLDLNVNSYNYAPTLNQVIADAVAKAVKAVELEQHTEVNASFNISDLFDDKNGDVLVYAAKTNIPGLVAEVNGTDITLTGAPTTAPKDGQLVISVTDGANKIDKSFAFAEVAPSITNHLRDLLVGENKTWYRWNGEQDFDETNQTAYNYANCMAIKFVEGENKNSGIALLAEGEQCPTESSAFEPDGTWEANAEGHLIWAIPGEGDVTLTSFVDTHENDERQPRITVFEREKLVEVTKASNGKAALTTSTFESGFTLFKGQVSANTYWNDASGSIWVNGKDVAIDLSAQHGQFTANEQFDYIDVDLYFNGMQCSELGLVANEHGTFEPTFPGSRYEWFRITGEALNGNAFYFNASDKGFKAFQSGSDCAVNLDITEAMATSAGANFKAGQALTVYGSEASNIGDEEFIINTFIDRDFSIQPKEDLIISETGIFFVDGMSVSNVYRSEQGGKTVFLERAMDYENGAWSEWWPFGDSQLITQYVTANGRHAYQFFNEGDHYNSDESFTIWADTAGTMSMKDADSDEVWTQKYFTSEAEAKKAVEAVVTQSINFVGSTWRETFVTGGESSEYSDYAYVAEGYTITSSPAAEYDGFYAWEKSPLNDLPCMYEVNHTCTYEELNKSYPWEGAWVKWEWDPVTDANKMWRHKDNHESEWVRLK